MIVIQKIKFFFAWVKNNFLAIKKLFMIAGSIAVVALFLSVGITVVLLALDAPERRQQRDAEIPVAEDEDDDDELTIAIDVRPEEEEDEEQNLIPARTNFILVGLDNSSLADAIMVGTFYRDSGDIHLMSVPRDMVARIPSHRMEKMRADGLRPPQILKINELRSYGGLNDGIYYLKDHIGEMLGVDFDFHLEVKIPAFRRIVDAIGHVEMYIPRRLFYEDPDQNLKINVPAGLQRLDGNMAEGVVRYRQWPMGDLQRNEMQMQFMTALIQQASKREALLNNPREIISTVLEEVRSDIGLVNALLYVPLIPRVSTESVRTFTMPGSVGNVSGREYFIPDSERLPATVSDVFYNVSEIVESEEKNDDD
ncbi:MAG: LCP family protein [Defluviitaleaceae bacterium]|nr:LCP family protein [Defluviitaleaceae bacterium]